MSDHDSVTLRTNAALGGLAQTHSSVETGLELMEHFKSLRSRYLGEALTHPIRLCCQRAGIALSELIQPQDITQVERERICLTNSSWGSWDFHLANRIHLNRKSSSADFELFFTLVPVAKQQKKVLERIILEGARVEEGSQLSADRQFYDLSILPLNLMLGSEVLAYFLPPEDYFEPHPTKLPDPYGIIQGLSRARIGSGDPVTVLDDSNKLILGSHKFTHTLLFNMDFYCPIGCSDCYKTRFGTREYMGKDVTTSASPTHPVYHHSKLGWLKPPNKDQLATQTRKTVEWMNDDPRGQQVYDVILSGGEPLALPNATIEQVLNEFRKARNLRILRICTGTLFLGLPFRLNDALLDILSVFAEETGIRVTIQAHLGNHAMITPEAVIHVHKIRQRGFPIYSQIPIKAGVNFFMDDIDKTISYLVELGRMQAIVGVEPYMFIVDMHPSTNSFYVPIESLMAVWGRLVESHDLPGLERPRTLSILFQKGNIVLSGNTLLTMEKAVNKADGIVTYTIPRIGITSEGTAVVDEVFEYQEPLTCFNDDPGSLTRLQKRWDSIRQMRSSTATS